MTSPSTAAVLVIGYGNELRGDDGLGPRLAGAIEELRLPGVQVITCQQLTPELAEPISHSDAVVFVDAAVDAAQAVQVRWLAAATRGQASAHTSDPGVLLGIAQQLFGRSPPGWWITVPAFELGFRLGLSDRAEVSMRTGLRAFEQLWPTLTVRGR